MKSLISLTVQALSVLLLSSNCNDKPILSKETKILRGRLMYNCDTPAPNESVKFKAGISFIENIDGAIEVFTDENEFFEFIHNQGGSWFTLWAPYKMITDVPSKPELDLGEINLNGTVNFVVKLLVNNNSYTSSGTLYYYDWNYPENGASHWVKKIAGPFQSGVIDSILNKTYTKYTIFHNQSPVLSIRHYINSNPYVDIEFQTPFCTSFLSDAVIVIN